jgi:hypothetical protein
MNMHALYDPYMATHGPKATWNSSWLSMTLHYMLWLCMTSHDSSWPHMTLLEITWFFMTSHDIHVTAWNFWISCDSLKMTSYDFTTWHDSSLWPLWITTNLVFLYLYVLCVWNVLPRRIRFDRSPAIHVHLFNTKSCVPVPLCPMRMECSASTH